MQISQELQDDANMLETLGLTKNESKTNVWNKMVHASFRKVVAFDCLFLGIGILIGIGIGVFIIKGP